MPRAVQFFPITRISTQINAENTDFKENQRHQRESASYFLELNNPKMLGL